MEETPTDDECRLLQFFRCLSPENQSTILFETAFQAIEECIPDKSLYDLMPTAAGIEPEGIKYIENNNSVAHIIYCGIQETGDPFETLLGSSYFDEEESIPRFVEGAEKSALEQNSHFNYDKDFVRQYLTAWRNEIALACKNQKLK